MSVLELIKNRRSVGLMTQQRPSKEIIERILEAATYAPNHHEVEPWKFIVIAGEARVELGNLMATILAEKMPETTSEKAVAALTKEQNKPLRAPVIIVAASLEPSQPKVVDIENVEAVAAGVQNMLLVIEEEGLAAIWRSGGPAYEPRIKEFLGLKPHEHIVGFVYLGYPAVRRTEAHRTPHAQKTEWRGWND
jgi:nitroreductase